MATQIKVLGSGVLGTSEVAVYGPVAQGKSALVKNMRFVNNSGSTRSLQVLVKRTGQTARFVLPSGTQMSSSVMNSYNSEIALEYTDSLEAYADAASAIQFVISGIERDA